MTIKETKKVIVGVNSFQKDWKNFYKVEYVDWAKDGTYKTKDWEEKDKLVKIIKFIIIPWEVFAEDKNFVWKDIKAICQELSWKSLFITTQIK